MHTSWPATHAVPLVGLVNVATILTVVVLPAPFGPSRPRIPP
ncbi:putative membrane protein [Mycobacterium ulcerans str. Harvey]|uniref:Membrane protein n=1 Tax=Mycobacterium ulcerans str. Harvey TaxID=1299332 RepID=A0ABN0QSU3_MYCUL|nr:putative membrane protein [Mycobacterium ulcerans str. Harvey]